MSEAKGQNMSDAQLNDVGHENALTRDELLAASAITQFYAFASRCMEWANTTRSLQARGLCADGTAVACCRGKTANVFAT